MKHLKLEGYIVGTFIEIQKHLYFIQKESKFTEGELAKEMNMTRQTYSKKFKNLDWTAKELLDLVNLLDRKLFPNLHEEIIEESEVKNV